MVNKYCPSKDKIESQENVSPMPVTYHIVLPAFREDLFTSSGVCNRLAYLIFETSVLHRYSLYAFCIMPDHVHILCSPGDVLLEHFVDLLKLRFEYALLKSGHRDTIWQSDFKGYSLPDDTIVDAATFIYENPVRVGLVADAKDYPYSYVCEGKQYRP